MWSECRLRSTPDSDAQPPKRLCLSLLGPLLLVIGAFACNAPFHRCTSDSECSAAQWCDPSIRVCVQYARPQGGVDNVEPSDVTGAADAGSSSDSGVTSDGGGARDGGDASDAGSSSDSGSRNADAGEGPALAITITTPASDGRCGTSCEGALVSAKDTQVAFSGSVNDPVGLSGTVKVSLTRGSATVVTDTAQLSGGNWSWTWETSGLTDDGATYTFAIAATNSLGQAATATRTLWVDRQGPSQTARFPAPDAAGVWPLDPIHLTFSERLLPSSVQDSAVTVLSNGAIAVSKRPSLSADGRTLTIKLLTPPTAGGQLKISFAAAGLTDLLGNAMTSPATPWQWTVAPVWVELAQMLGSSSNHILYNYGSVTGIDSGGVLVSLVTDNSSSLSGSPAALNVTVYNVDTMAWTSRGSPYSAKTGAVRATIIALGADSTPYIAMTPIPGTAPIVLQGTNDGGTSWSALSSPKGLSNFCVAFDSTPLVALGSALSRWSGVEWLSMGSLNPEGSTVSGVSIGLGVSRIPLVGLVSTTGTSSSLVVDAWSGSGWTPLGQSGGLQQDPSSAIGAPKLSINSKGQPVALWFESGSTLRLFVSTLEDGTTWRATELTPPCIGTFWLDSEDGVIDVCADTTSRWDGLDWIPLGNTLPVADYRPDVKVGATPRGWPAVVWMEQNGPAPTFKARRFNR